MKKLLIISFFAALAGTAAAQGQLTITNTSSACNATVTMFGISPAESVQPCSTGSSTYGLVLNPIYVAASTGSYSASDLSAVNSSPGWSFCNNNPGPLVSSTCPIGNTSVPTCYPDFVWTDAQVTIDFTPCGCSGSCTYMVNLSGNNACGNPMSCGLSCFCACSSRTVVGPGGCSATVSLTWCPGGCASVTIN